MLRKLLPALLLSVIASPAAAEWREATSRNFVVYSEGSEKELRNFTANLEKFDYLLRVMTNISKAPSGNKLTVYLLPNHAAVSRSMLAPTPGVAGYYSYNPRGAYFVGISNNRGDADDLKGQAVLLHEYTHHFMYQYSPATYPAWYSEGFAEYYGTARFLDNDVIEVGLPADHRYGSFRFNRWVPLGKLLSARDYGDIGADIDLLYAQGWLLVHYLQFNREREGQLAAYLNAINNGVSYEQAMSDTFGEGAKKLNSELLDYAGRRKLASLRLPFKKIDTGDITVRGLRPGEEALMDHQITLSRGIAVREAADFAKSIRKIAGSYPDDPAVLLALVEAERAAGNLEAASDAARRLLTAAPGMPRAAMHAARIDIERLKTSGAGDAAAWNAARGRLVAAHEAAPNDPMVLDAYYDSFTAEGVLPPPGAQNALYRAHELLPQDGDLAYKLAYDFEQRGFIEDALSIIRPRALAIRDREESEREKERRERDEEKYRLTGEAKRETARDMMLRLEKKLAEGKNAAAG